jgi:curli biogenesis system outer membrane secretion channel CsgG
MPSSNRKIIPLAAVMALTAMMILPPVWAQDSDTDFEEPTTPIEQEEQKAPEENTAPSTPDRPEGILTEPIKDITGPRRTVAVGRFDAVGAFTSKYGNWDIGGGLSAMLTTALVESNRFIVSERAQIQQILTEQEMKGQKLTSQGSGPKLGKLIGVQFLILGSVTEFGAEEEGHGFSIGGSGGGIGSLLSGALSGQFSSGTVAMDFRVVDTTTGQVLESFNLSEDIESSGFDLSLGYQGINFGGNQFNKTPLGQASRRVITRAVQKFAINAENIAWTGQVVEFDAGELFINAGAQAGMKKGDAFMIERITKRLTDPSTGEVLMLRKEPLGMVELQMVAPKIASGRFQPLAAMMPQRGDLVVVLKK